jgi:hypothetical protein
LASLVSHNGPDGDVEWRVVDDVLWGHDNLRLSSNDYDRSAHDDYDRFAHDDYDRFAHDDHYRSGARSDAQPELPNRYGG